MTLKRLYGAFTKVTKNDDGTLEVEGIASSEAVDSDGEIIKADAMKAAIPGYMKFGAVREMHASIAAGTALSCEVNDEGQTILRAHVVDASSVKKVLTKVLKGFSIGGKVTGRDSVQKTTITGLDLVEISLVDRPANPDAVITMFKADGIEIQPVVETVSETEPVEKTAVVVDPEVAAVDALAASLNKGEVSATMLLDLIAKHKAEQASLKKGLYGVSVFADVLCSIGYLAASAGNEADWEGDSSPVPGQLRDWVASGAKIFVSMATEEANELVAELRTAAGEVDMIEMAAKSGIDLTKAGAKFSAKTKETLTNVHKAVGDAHAAMAKHGAALQKCDEDMTALGYSQEGDDDSDQAGADKAASATNGNPAPVAPAAAQTTAGDPAAPGAPVEKAQSISQFFMRADEAPAAVDTRSFQELLLGSMNTVKAAAVVDAEAAAPAAIPTEPKRPALMVVEKTGEAVPISGASAPGSPGDANAAIRKAFGMAPSS